MTNSLERFGVPRRRALLLQAAALTALQPSRSFKPGVPDKAGRDAALLEACAGFCDIERQKLALFYGSGRVRDDDERTSHLGPLDAAQAPFVDAMCRYRAIRMPAHRARALAFLLADGGELYGRARHSGCPDERMLAAIVRDLENQTEC